MTTKTTTYTWKGTYTYRLSGSGLHEDTLRIKSNYAKHEQMLKLILPTLCITYADMKFQNKVGGEQKNYPVSEAYGPRYFDPPVKITGEKDIERFTYIRGANRVEIGPRTTTIEFPSWKELVVPRLRISQKERVKAVVQVPPTLISVDQPLQISVRQYADGRHIGGVRLEKRHPNWQPAVEKETYDLWLRVIDGVSHQPLPEVRVDIRRWDPKAPSPYGAGCFHLDEHKHTDKDGSVYAPGRSSGALEAFIVRLPGHRAVVRCLRPLAGQKVRLQMCAWPLTKDAIRYEWKAGDTVDGMSQLTGNSIEEILRLNSLKDSSDLKPGIRIMLPCYLATYRMEQWDTFDEIGKTFGYYDAKGLAEANGLLDPADLDGGAELRLPDWRFFYARERDTLEAIDTIFDLLKGSAITVGRAYHPDPRLPYGGETVAVPTARFSARLQKKRVRIETKRRGLKPK